MKQIIVIRKDLKMGRGKEIAQACHASMKATLENMDDIRVQAWLDGIFKKIAVGVNSEEELLQLYQEAKDKGLIAALITDSGLTVFNGVPTNTCIAIGPDHDDILNPITGGLKLL